MIYAHSFIEEQRADLAMGYLAGLDGPEALELRAKAHLLAGEFTPAANLYERLDQSEQQATAAWLGQDIDTVLDVGNSTEKAIAEFLTARNGNSDQQALGPLALNQAMLEQSREARQLLDRLLAEKPVP